jgi:hypothetical protein
MWMNAGKKKVVLVADKLPSDFILKLQLKDKVKRRAQPRVPLISIIGNTITNKLA